MSEEAPQAWFCPDCNRITWEPCTECEGGLEAAKTVDLAPDSPECA